MNEMKIPCKCPICLGTGIVPGGFYESGGNYWTSINTTELCRQCQGSGIIWSQGEPDKDYSLTKI